jgi:hypothetical protein
MPSKSDMKKDEPVLEINGEFFPIKDLPQGITELLSLFTTWETEKVAAVREVQKIDAALKSVSLEISSRMAVWRAHQAANDSNDNDGLDGPNR